MRGLNLLLLSAIAAGAFSACGNGEAPPPPPRPVLVEHPLPLAGDAGEVFPGSVRAREEADLAFRVSGKILKRSAEAGDRVRPGAVLATLDPEDAALNLKASESTVAAAEADMKLAESELTRHKDLLDKGFISKSLYDVRENTFRLAQARHEQAQSAFAVVRNQNSYTTLSADKAGLITAVLAEAGQVVAAGQPVFRFATGGEREVVIYVPEGRVEALNKATLAVTLWARPGRRYTAKLREVNMQADRSTRTHEARVSILDADDSIQLGMTATVLMGAKMDGQLFSVPLSALGMVKEQAVLWTVDAESRTRPLPVQVMRYVETAAIVSGALTPQMKIVSAGVPLMVDGQQVTTVPRQRAAAAAAVAAPAVEGSGP